MEKKYIVLAVVITALVLLGISEGVKANNRKAALENLNKVYPTLKTETEKVAAVVKANAIIASNRSFFDFSTSDASEWGENGPQGEDEFPLLEGGDINWVVQRIEANVTTADVTTIEVWYNPQSNQWEPFGDR